MRTKVMTILVLTLVCSLLAILTWLGMRVHAAGSRREAILLNEKNHQLVVSCYDNGRYIGVVSFKYGGREYLASTAGGILEVTPVVQESFPEHAGP